LSPRNYWTLIKKLLGNQFLSGIPALENNGQIANTDLEKVSLSWQVFDLIPSRDLDETNHSRPQ
jgi:hypothetical protein